MGDGDGTAEGRMERSAQAVATRRIAHAAHGLFGIRAAADHRKIDSERADIHRRFRQPWLVGGNPRQGYTWCARGGRYHPVRGSKIDRTGFEIDNDPVEP